MVSEGRELVLRCHGSHPHLPVCLGERLTVIQRNSKLDTYKHTHTEVAPLKYARKLMCLCVRYEAGNEAKRDIIYESKSAMCKM